MTICVTSSFSHHANTLIILVTDDGMITAYTLLPSGGSGGSGTAHASQHCRDDGDALATRASKSGRDFPREFGDRNDASVEMMER